MLSINFSSIFLKNTNSLYSKKYFAKNIVVKYMPVKVYDVSVKYGAKNSVEPFHPRYFPRVSSGLKFFKNEHRAHGIRWVLFGIWLVEMKH